MAKRFSRGTLPEVLHVPWGIKQGLGAFALVWLGLPIALILATRALAPYLPLANSLLQGLRSGDIIASFVEVVIDALAGFGLVWYYLHRYHVGWSAVGWRKFSAIKALGILAGIFLVFTVGVNLLLALVSVLVPAFNSNQAQTNDFTGTRAMHQPLLSLLALVIIPPFIEETVFRGFIFPAFSKRYGTVIGAVASSLLFGFAHLQANVSIYTFALGLVLCFMYVKLRSIFPGIALHMLNNYLAFIAITGK